MENSSFLLNPSFLSTPSCSYHVHVHEKAVHGDVHEKAAYAHDHDHDHVHSHGDDRGHGYLSARLHVHVHVHAHVSAHAHAHDDCEEDARRCACCDESWRNASDDGRLLFPSSNSRPFLLYDDVPCCVLHFRLAKGAD